MASMWLGDEDTTSTLTEFFQSKAKQPVLPALGPIQQWSNFSSSHNHCSLTSPTHVSAKNKAVGSYARVTTSSSWTVRMFPSPRTFQQSPIHLFRQGWRSASTAGRQFSSWAGPTRALRFGGMGESIWLREMCLPKYISEVWLSLRWAGLWILTHLPSDWTLEFLRSKSMFKRSVSGVG